MDFNHQHLHYCLGGRVQFPKATAILYSAGKRRFKLCIPDQAFWQVWRGDPVKLVQTYILWRSMHASTALSLAHNFQFWPALFQNMFACLALAILAAIYFPDPCCTLICTPWAASWAVSISWRRNSLSIAKKQHTIFIPVLFISFSE